MHVVQRADDEVDAVLAEAREQLADPDNLDAYVAGLGGYVDGVAAGINWLLGLSEEHPFKAADRDPGSSGLDPRDGAEGRP
jgi:hypothetical protein